MASAVGSDLSAGASAVESQLRRLRYSAPDPAQLALDVAATLRDMRANLERRCAADRARFESAAARIATLNPLATLARGFAIVEKEGAKKKPVVNSIKNVKPGDRLSVSVGDGAFWAEVS